ncbi:MAG: hypothetical protein WEA56_16310 [Balneolaceae bacterium]
MSSKKATLSRINGRIVPVTLEYMRKIINQGCNDIYLLRNGLSHRIGAIIFHEDILKNMIKNITQDALDNPFDFHSNGKDLIYTFRLSYLFDDLIFNMMSFYDYLAGFIGYIVYDDEIRSLAVGYDPLDQRGKKVNHLRSVLYKMSWTSIAEMCKGDSNKNFLKFRENKFFGTELSQVIKAHDEKFIEKLSKYRNRIIHNESDSPNLHLRISIPSNSKINFFTPPSFEKYFGKSPKNFEEALKLLINSFADSIEEIFNALETYIESNRKVEKGKEFVLYKHELEDD